MERLFLWKKPASNSVSPRSTKTTSFRREKVHSHCPQPKEKAEYFQKAVIYKINKCLEMLLFFPWKKKNGRHKFNIKSTSNPQITRVLSVSQTFC